MTLLVRSIVVLVAAAPLGCFVDGGGTGPDDDAQSGTTGFETTTSTPVTADTTDDSAAASTTSPTETTDAATSTSTTGPDPDTGSSDSSSSSTESSSTESSSTSGEPDVLSVDELMPGDLVITEMMGNPSCPGDDCEWFELLNTTDTPIDLEGLGVGDVDDIDAEAPGAFVNTNAILEPGSFGVLARMGPWPYDPEVIAMPLARYPNTVALSNGSFDTIGIFGAGGLLLDEAATFLGDNDLDGRSRELTDGFLTADQNDVSAAWCWSDTELEVDIGQDWGTPGLPPGPCLPE